MDLVPPSFFHMQRYYVIHGLGLTVSASMIYYNAKVFDENDQ